MGGNRRIVCSLALLSAWAQTGCQRKTPAGTGGAPLASVSAHPIALDRLGDGEAVPGKEVVFELALPRGSRVTGRFDRTVYATLPLTPDDAATWLRHNTATAEAVIGPGGTNFDRVRLAGWPKSRWLHVMIGATPVPKQASVTVEQIEEPAPLPQATPLANEEVMRRAGLSPDGKVLDPGGIGGISTR